MSIRLTKELYSAEELIYIIQDSLEFQGVRLHMEMLHHEQMLQLSKPVASAHLQIQINEYQSKLDNHRLWRLAKSKVQQSDSTES